MDTEANVRRYWAFISYSHTDKAWADWLHKSLERYPLPKDLVGRKTPSEDPAPKRFVPVFRDREELPTATDLGAVIAKALKHARFLVVICSPRSAKSQWVEQEIISYKRLYGENRVLCLIVEGEPWASDGKPGSSPDQECFPKAVRYRLGANGNLSDQRTEPIAADARETGDGKQNAFIKLMAGLLGVGFDDLRRRDQEYQRRRVRIFRALTGLFALLFLAAISAATYAAIQKHKVQQTLSQADLQLALVARDKDEVSQSAAYLARSLRSDPANREAAVAAWSLLAHRQHHAPVGPALRHPNAVVAAVGSADEKWIATGSGSEVYLWSRPDHKLVTKQSPDGSPVTAFSLDTDRKGFVVSTRSGKIHHLSFDSLKPFSEPIATGSVPAIQVTWSPKGDQLAVALAGDDAGSNGGTLVRFAADGRELERIPATHLVPKVIAWSPDGTRLAVAGDSPNVLLATIGEKSSATQTLKSKLAVTGLHFITADQLTTIDVFTGLQTWDLVKGIPSEAKQLAPSVSGAAFSPDGRSFLGTRRGPAAYVYDSSTGKIATEPISPGFTISNARWLDNRHVLLTSENGLAQVRRIRNAIPAAAAVCVPDGYPEAVALHADGFTLAVAYTEDSLVRFYDTRTMTATGHPVRFPSKVLSLGFSDDGKTLAVLGWDGHLHTTRWEHALKIETGKDLIAPPTTSSYSKATLGQFAPKGNVLAIPDGRELIFADLLTGTIKTRKQFDRKVASLAWTDDGSTLLVAREDQLLSFQRPDGSPAPNRPVIRLNAPAIELADGGERVAVLSNADRIDCFDSHSGAPSGTSFQAGANITGLKWDAAHEWVIAGDMDGRASLWDPTAGQALGHLPRSGNIWHGGVTLPGRSAELLRLDESMTVVPLLPPGRVPDWLPSFLEGFCGNRLAEKKDDTLIDVDAWRSSDAAPSPGEKGPWVDLYYWLMNDAADRPAAPGSTFNESQTRDNLMLQEKSEQLIRLQKTIQEEWNSNETPRMQKAADLLDNAIALLPGNTANHKVKVLMATTVGNAGLIRNANLGLAAASDATLIEILDAKAEAAKQCLAMTPPQTDQARALIDEILKENPEHAATLELRKQLK
ncbi:TIR domain-containing protein [Luteolibacter ambystomatis]|uniref:TIR domain-containing protein n=1 Tax=Luteolibacter ambystomatis TaxID=2824561 RepID=A0A975J217_9BACT|nr:toll/interleukin-1 receptor domain-containing protein [Luteolibacter ambystomatis]QUE52595.1 TIR domain-containing protein [Luteolibacter ambystomatis]